MKKKNRKVNNEFDRFKLMQRIKLDVEGMGWNVNAIDPNFTDFFVYLLDLMDTGFVFAFSGGYEGLLEAEKNTLPMNEITGGLGTLIKQQSSEHELLAQAAICYFVKTKTYGLLKQKLPIEEGVPVVVIIRYGRKGNTDGSLRPFALVHDTGIFTPEELIGLCSPVITQDKQAHPEWFPSATILPIKAK